MPDRKHRKSAAAMMMVAGGLVAAVAAPIDSPLAQEVNIQQGTTAVQCNGFVPAEISVVGNKLFVIGKDGTKTLAADGQWKTSDGKVIIVQKGIIVSE